MDQNMPLLGFGAMRLPTLGAEDKIDLPQVSEMTDLFMEKGFRYFDTAYVYHGGKSETALRDALVKRYPRDSFCLATKMPLWNVRKTEDLERIFAEQLTRAGLTYIDYYMLHAMDSDREKTAVKTGAYDFLGRLKKEGRIRFAGVSFHDSAEILDRMLTDHPELDFVQLQINYLDMKRGPAESWYNTARKHNKPIIVMEPIKGGSLARLAPAAEAVLREACPDTPPASWAMRYAASLPGVFTVLSGMSALEQMEDNVKTFENFIPLTAEEDAVLDKALAELGKVSGIPCTGCKYCLEACPKQIPIPQIFSCCNELQRVSGDAKWNCKQLYASIPESRNASSCIACAACEAHCPQKIRIPEELKKAAAALR